MQQNLQNNVPVSVLIDLKIKKQTNKKLFDLKLKSLDRVHLYMYLSRFYLGM